MKQVLILLAGYPGTGKTYMCNKIMEQEPDFVVVSRDDIKEQLFDEYGFNNLEEKKSIEDMGWIKYYEAMEAGMKNGSRLISDYPFSDKQKGKLQNLSETYGYEVITIRLIGDLSILFERSRKRDLDPGRHLGHVVSKYQNGDVLIDRSKGDCFLSYDTFMERCKNRGYGTFELGHLIEVDVTDFGKIPYPVILEQLKKLLS